MSSTPVWSYADYLNEDTFSLDDQEFYPYLAASAEGESSGVQGSSGLPPLGDSTEWAHSPAEAPGNAVSYTPAPAPCISTGREVLAAGSSTSQ